jgi:hypothetical protein
MEERRFDLTYIPLTDDTITITISMERFVELTRTECDAKQFRGLIKAKAEKLDAISYSEVRFLADLLGITYDDPFDKKEREGKENG